MDYVEVFKDLRANNKYGRKSPHKAVLMLTVIELYEHNVLSDNIIPYDDALKSMFLKVWNKVFPTETLFRSDAYLPFWYLQSDSFWHIVPARGKEDILSLMRDTSIKPSETKIEECVRYAELDEDLYFLMTLPSGRSSLKRTLLETYTQLSEKQIDKFAESSDNIIDYSISAVSDYEKFISNEGKKKDVVLVRADDDLVRQFQSLNEDIQIVLNLQYYSFLKSHRNEREMLKEVCPTVYDLLDKIVNNPINQGDIAPSFAFTYDNFLSDLKIALMSEDDSMELIDKIGEALEKLRGNNNVEITTPISENKESEIPASDSGKITCGDKEDVLSQDYVIENHANRCCIIDNRGVQVFSSSGKLIRLNNIFYGISYTDSLVSMVIIQETRKGTFSLGRRIISAHKSSPLFSKLDNQDYLKQFKAVKYDSDCDEYYIQIDNRWYGSSGYYADLNEGKTTEVSNNASLSDNQANLIDNVESTRVKESVPDSALVEHLILDSDGDVIKTISSSQLEGAVSSENRNGKPWTKKEEDLITRLFKGSIDTSKIAKIIGRTEVAIKSRLAKLGLIVYTYGQEESPIRSFLDKLEKPDEKDFRIENSNTGCCILNISGDILFYGDGKLKFIKGRLYRLNLKKECFTVKEMLYEDGRWVKGDKKIVAYPKAKLYTVIGESPDYSLMVEEIDDNPIFEKCRIRVVGEWYSYDGTLETSISKKDNIKEKAPVDDVEDFDSQFSVRIGDTLKVFPTQVVGKVVKLRIDKTGHKKIIVKSTSGDVVEIYDSKYLYQKQLQEAYTESPKKKKERINHVVKGPIPQDGIEQNIRKYAVIGCWIQWKPTGELGKVTSFFKDGPIRKMVIRNVKGEEKEVYDNPSSYDVIFDRGDSRAPDVEVQEANIQSSTNNKVRVGDRIKIKNYNTSCKVVRIEGFAASFTKLIVEFDDGRQDWIINNPDLYTIL